MTKIIYSRGIRRTIVGIEERADGTLFPGKPVRRLTLDCGHIEDFYQKQYGENRTHRTGEPRDCYQCGVEARRAQSRFVGAIGQRIKATVSVTSGQDHYYYVGDEFDARKKWVTDMCDADGNELVVEKKFCPETHEVLKIEGTVKQHRTSVSDIAETVVSIRRCKRLGWADNDRPATKAPAKSKLPTRELLIARGWTELKPSGKGYAFAIGLPQPRHTAAQPAVIDALARSLGRPPTASEIVLALAAHANRRPPDAPESAQ